MRIRRWTTRLVCLLALAALCACGKPGETQPANVDGARLRAAASEANNWISVGRTWSEDRYSPLDQINTETVNRLGLAWFADLDTDRGVEATPLVIDGVLYNIQPWNITTAYDAANGRVIWRHDPQVPRRFGGIACCDIVTRGLAAWNGKIYLATLDGRLIALDARTGEPVWTTQTLDPKWPYTITGAPRVYDGKVIIGNAGAEGAARGYVSAYDAETGARVWRFYTVPGNPADRFSSEAERVAAATWRGEWWERGGGATVWDSLAYDPDLRLVYAGTGNGGPWTQRYRSPGGGDNLFVSSILALKVDTGEYVWHYQTTPGDEWDYTATAPMILADLEIGGRERKVLMQAPKNGFFYILDRATGELLSAEPYVQGITWASHVDLATGRPAINPAARYGETPVLVSPGAAGGHNWHPMSFSPRTGYVYFPALQAKMVYAVNPDFQQTPGRMSQLGLATTGHEAMRGRYADEIARTTRTWLMAYDPVAKREVWRVPYPRRGSGGTLVTAGDVVFQGTINTTFAAYHARTGAKLWEEIVQQAPIAGAMTYAVDGVQYVAVNAGWGGGLTHQPASNDRGLQLSRSARLLVYRLDGEASLPPIDTAREGATSVNEPPPDTADEATIRRGRDLYAQTCAQCHGGEARGGIKDLRMMTPKTHAEFMAIVREGTRTERGMVSFADTISDVDAQAIHAYVIRRANQDWNGSEID